MRTRSIPFFAALLAVAAVPVAAAADPCDGSTMSFSFGPEGALVCLGGDGVSAPFPTEALEALREVAEPHVGPVLEALAGLLPPFPP